MARWARRSKTLIQRKQAETLIFPLAMFLGIGGLSRRDAEASFSSAYRRALSSARGLRMQHIGHPTPYADIMGLWAKDERFLRETGKPRTLSVRGKNSLATLLHEASPSSRLEDVIEVLVRYKNIRRVRLGRYELVKSFFTSDRASGIAFEPIAYFLSDASTTLRRFLDRRTQIKEPAPFWRKVEAVNLTAASARKFSEFARERTLTYLEEIDDWLDAHKASGRKKAKKRRVGVGVFSIYSDPESDNPAI